MKLFGVSRYVGFLIVISSVDGQDTSLKENYLTLKEQYLAAKEQFLANKEREHSSPCNLEGLTDTSPIANSTTSVGLDRTFPILSPPKTGKTTSVMAEGFAAIKGKKGRKKEHRKNRALAGTKAESKEVAVASRKPHEEMIRARVLTRGKDEMTFYDTSNDPERQNSRQLVFYRPIFTWNGLYLYNYYWPYFGFYGNSWLLSRFGYFYYYPWGLNQWIYFRGGGIWWIRFRYYIYWPYGYRMCFWYRNIFGNLQCYKYWLPPYVYVGRKLQDSCTAGENNDCTSSLGCAGDDCDDDGYFNLNLEDLNLDGPVERMSLDPDYGSDPQPENFMMSDLEIQTYREPDAGGDPHFLRWGQQKRDSFHGECDLVFIRSDDINDGQGLDIHVRTTIRDNLYSFIEAVAVRIGKNILEFQSDTIWLNGQKVSSKNLPLDLQDDGHAATVFKVESDKSKRVTHIQLSHTASVTVKSTNSFMHVSVNGNALDFGNSVGLLGDYSTGAMHGRDGKVMDDYTDYGFEWQVNPEDGQLFMENREPQLPYERCRVSETFF